MITFPNYPSIGGSNALVINKSNYRQYAGLKPSIAQPSHENLVPVLKGSTGYMGWSKPGEPHKFKGPKPIEVVTPRSQWVADITAAAAKLKADKPGSTGNLILDNILPAKDQDGRSLCWCYGSTRAVEYRRYLEGLTYLQLAPESVAGPCTNWRDEGGYASQAFNQLQTGGACEESFLNAPCSLSPKLWKTGWQANAELHEAVDWYNIDGSEAMDGTTDVYQAVISVLMDQVGESATPGSPVAAGLSWWSHLICFLAPIILQDGTVGVIFQNSWGESWPVDGANGIAVLTEDMATPDGSASPTLTVDFASDTRTRKAIL